MKNIEVYYEKALELYKSLHEHAEVGFDLLETVKIVKKELADLGIVHIVLCEEIGVRPDMAVVDDAAVTQLHKGAEGGVIDNAGGVDQGFVFS